MPALGQDGVATAPVTIVLSAVYSRTTERYDERGVRYAHMEAGHAAQNAHLQGVALDLGSVPIGAFEDEEVRRVLGLSNGEEPLYLLPFGKPAGE